MAVIITGDGKHSIENQEEISGGEERVVLAFVKVARVLERRGQTT